MTKADAYIASLREIEIRLARGGDLIADLGNITAALNKRVPCYWIGFYILKDEDLVLGPFQGTPACVFIPLGQGVCGQCAERKETIIVPDVSRFEGHIACDPHSKSEIVVPLFDRQDTLRGVLDADSDSLNQFDETDQRYLEQLADRIRPIWPV